MAVGNGGEVEGRRGAGRVRMWVEAGQPGPSFIQRETRNKGAKSSGKDQAG